MNLFPVSVLLVVLLLIMLRRLGPVPIKMWQAMATGAMVVLAAGAISPTAALRAIDANVMLFLFGAFVIGQALTRSGYLFYLACRVLGPARSGGSLVWTILLLGAVASALLMNDTLAIIGTPLMLRLAREHDLNPKLLLMTLAFAVTTGSIISPIGNPQNLLVSAAIDWGDPFVVFARHLFLPACAALLAAYLVLRIAFRPSFHSGRLRSVHASINDPQLAHLARWSMWLLVGLLVIRIALPLFAVSPALPFGWVALLAALPILIFSRERFVLLREIDWATLVFFCAMFVLMTSVWNSGALQWSAERLQLDYFSVPSVLSFSILASQLVSNVPLVALYLPVLEHAGSSHSTLMALAAGSTLAGNFFIIGAASNVIIVQGAERHGVVISFVEFARIGLALTLIQSGVFWWFLT